VTVTLTKGHLQVKGEKKQPLDPGVNERGGGGGGLGGGWGGGGGGGGGGKIRPP